MQSARSLRAALLLVTLALALPAGAEARGHSGGSSSGGSSHGSSSGSGGHGASGSSSGAGGSSAANGGSGASASGAGGASVATGNGGGSGSPAGSGGRSGAAAGAAGVTSAASGAGGASGASGLATSGTSGAGSAAAAGISGGAGKLLSELFGSLPSRGAGTGPTAPPAGVTVSKAPPGHTNPGGGTPPPASAAPTGGGSAPAAAAASGGFTLAPAPPSGGSGGGGGGSSSGGSAAAPPPLPTPGAPIVSNTKLGVGLYGGVPMDTLRAMRPAVFLIEDPDPQAARDLRATFPKALIVGRHFVPDGDSSLANCQDPGEDHEAKGAAFADTIAATAVPLKGVIDAWVSDNEQAVATDRASLPCHAQFQSGFIQRLQGTYGVDAVAGNDAAGALEPEDYPKYFARPISQATYFGLHAYGKPGAGTLQSADNVYYGIRYRMVHDALVKAGVPLPKGGFLLTETGLYDGWRGAVPDDAMAADFVWLEQRLEEDDYVRGQMIFGLGLNNRFWNFDLQSTNVPALVGAFNAAAPGSS